MPNRTILRWAAIPKSDSVRSDCHRVIFVTRVLLPFKGYLPRMLSKVTLHLRQQRAVSDETV